MNWSPTFLLHGLNRCLTTYLRIGTEMKKLKCGDDVLFITVSLSHEPPCTLKHIGTYWSVIISSSTIGRVLTSSFTSSTNAWYLVLYRTSKDMEQEQKLRLGGRFSCPNGGNVLKHRLEVNISHWITSGIAAARRTAKAVFLCKHLVDGKRPPEYRSVIRSRFPPFLSFKREDSRFHALFDGDF